MTTPTFGWNGFDWNDKPAVPVAFASVGAAAGAGASAINSTSVHASSFTANGTGAASAISAPAITAMAAGIGAASGVGRATVASTGSSIGAGTAAFATTSVHAAPGTAAGLGAAIGLSAPTAIATAAGIGASSVKGAAIAASAGSAAGVSFLPNPFTTDFSLDFGAGPSTNAIGLAGGAAAAVGVAAGVGASSVISASAVSVGAAAGHGAAAAVGASFGTIAAVGASSGAGGARAVSPPGNIDITNCVSLTPVSFGPSSMVEPPPIQIRVIYGHNYTVQNSNLSGSATPTRIQLVATSDPTFANWTSSNISYRRPNNPSPFGIALLGRADAAQVANGLGALWGNRSSLYEAVLPTAFGLGFDIGDAVTVTYPVDDLSGGRKGQVVGERFQTGDPTLTLRILIAR